MRLIIICLAVCFVVSTANAETAYVTDNLRLGLHQAADTSDRAFRTMDSGQELDIVNRDRNYAQVRLPDGTNGYVKAAYLVFDKPAKLIVEETQARVDELENELEKARSDFAAPAATIASLEQKLADVDTDVQGSNAIIADLTEANDNYRRRHDQFKYSMPITWVLAALAVCGFAGFLAGMWWLDHRSRKRHGGIRVY